MRAQIRKNRQAAALATPHFREHAAILRAERRTINAANAASVRMQNDSRRASRLDQTVTYKSEIATTKQREAVLRETMGACWLVTLMFVRATTFWDRRFVAARDEHEKLCALRKYAQRAASKWRSLVCRSRTRRMALLINHSLFFIVQMRIWRKKTSIRLVARFLQDHQVAARLHFKGEPCGSPGRDGVSSERVWKGGYATRAIILSIMRLVATNDRRFT